MTEHTRPPPTPESVPLFESQSAKRDRKRRDRDAMDEWHNEQRRAQRRPFDLARIFLIESIGELAMDRLETYLDERDKLK